VLTYQGRSYVEAQGGSCLLHLRPLAKIGIGIIIKDIQLCVNYMDTEDFSVIHSGAKICLQKWGVPEQDELA